MAVNVVVLMGRLVADPILKPTVNGIEVCNFTIAVDRRYNKPGEERQADFLDCVAWRQSAVFVDKYFSKGSMIAVNGYIQTRTYEDNNGNKRKAFEIVADNVSFCGNKGQSIGGASSKPEESSSDADFQEIPEEDLPF